MATSQNFAPTSFNVENLAVSPCLVYFKGPSDQTYRHVGHTFGGVEVSMTQSAVECKSDEYGEAALKSVDSGTKMSVTAHLAEATFANLQMMFTTAQAVGTGNKEYMTFGMPVGTELITGDLVLQPTDGSSMFRIYRAAANVGSAINVTYDSTKQRVYPCKFDALIDTTRMSGDQLYRIGGVYALNPSLTLAPITPNNGSDAGTTTVTVNFDPAWCPDFTSLSAVDVTVTLYPTGTITGGVTGTNVTLTEDIITFKAPIHAAGIMDLLIAVVDGDDTYTFLSTAAFTYNAS